MRILIDDSIGIEIDARWAKAGDGDPDELVVPFDDNARLMDAWVAGDPAHRSYRYGNDDSNTDPSAVIVAWVSRGNGSLVMDDVDPWWNGSYTLNAYPLEALASALGTDVLKWGAAIDEPVDLGGREDRG